MPQTFKIDSRQHDSLAQLDSMLREVREVAAGDATWSAEFIKNEEGESVFQFMKEATPKPSA
jgi:hypothetical protein